MSKLCEECGHPLDGNERVCPICGNPVKLYQEQNIVQGNALKQKQSTDWANYIYESAEIYWDTIKRRYVAIKGRASRREYWSFVCVMCTFLALGGLLIVLFESILHRDDLCEYAVKGTLIVFLVNIIPWMCVNVRRLHDINKSGWWIFCPFVWLFLHLKRSDEGVNNYGRPTNVLYHKSIDYKVLIRCEGCGHMISNDAARCPHCGAFCQQDSQETLGVILSTQKIVTITNNRATAPHESLSVAEKCIVVSGIVLMLISMLTPLIMAISHVNEMYSNYDSDFDSVELFVEDYCK